MQDSVAKAYRDLLLIEIALWVLLPTGQFAMSTLSSQHRTFYYKSIQDFKALPTKLKQAPSFGKFKSSLKTQFLTT